MNMYNQKSKHRFQRQVFDKLGGPSVLYHPRLKILFGDINSAIWFCQALYWYDKFAGKELTKSRSQFTKETQLSRDQQIRAEKKLRKLGVVTITVKAGRPSPINHIVINFDVLDELILNLRGMRTLKDSNTVVQYKHFPKDISENTQKNIKIDRNNYFSKRKALIDGKSV